MTTDRPRREPKVVTVLTATSSDSHHGGVDGSSGSAKHCVARATRASKLSSPSYYRKDLIEAGRFAEGEAELEKALDFYRSVGATFLIERGERLLAEAQRASA
jgi:hypothetical protein